MSNSWQYTLFFDNTLSSEERVRRLINTLKNCEIRLAYDQAFSVMTGHGDEREFRNEDELVDFLADQGGRLQVWKMLNEETEWGLDFGVWFCEKVELQLVPYGRDHTNPAVVAEPKWDSPQTRELAKRACFDCHSNETVWPWYTNIAPASWLVERDVVEGRHEVNFSEWSAASGGRERKSGQKLGKVVTEGEMPPAQYTLIHSEAILSQPERQQLVVGFLATFGN